jgi:hypothetical protein
MPSGDLFESQTKRNINPVKWVIGAIALVVLCGGAYALFLYNSPTKMTPEQILAQEIRDNTVMLLDYSRFTGEEFREQILGKGRLDTFNRRDRDAYFTYPESEEQEFNDFLAKFFYNRERLEFATEKDGRMELGNYKLARYASRDCSNKSILLASLLEQIGEEYILLYCPQHITVAVPQGAFVNDNKLDFTWNQKSWVIAETTVAGFQVGKSKLTDPDRLNSVEYVQDPKLPDVIFDANSYAVLKFL